MISKGTSPWHQGQLPRHLQYNWRLAWIKWNIGKALHDWWDGLLNTVQHWGMNPHKRCSHITIIIFKGQYNLHLFQKQLKFLKIRRYSVWRCCWNWQCCVKLPIWHFASWPFSFSMSLAAGGGRKTALCILWGGFQHRTAVFSGSLWGLLCSLSESFYRSIRDWAKHRLHSRMLLICDTSYSLL